MTPDLPDDLRKWPTDPFAVLGVERGAAAVEIKRAYTRLIRKYKPEHHPDEFRRIREAYEACTAQSHWFFEAHIPAESQPLHEPNAQPVSTSDPEVKAEPRPRDEVDRFWDLAVAGQFEAAYTPLAGLAEQDRQRPDLPLRLYWLLSLEPELDSWRTRMDWLLEALKRSRLSGPAAELYRRELSVDPEAALYGHFQELLEIEAGAFEKLSVGRMRFTAAARSQSWNSLIADVKALARCLPQVNESAWLSYLVTGIDWTSWDRPMPLYGMLREEARRLRHLELTQGFFFDRLEEVEHISDSWLERASGVLPAGWIRLLPMAWAMGGGLTVDDVKAAANEVAADPSQAMLRFDRVIRDLGPAILAVLTRSLDQIYYGSGLHATEFPADWIRGLALRLPGGWMRGYDHLREDLLNFLLVNSLHPDEFIAACEVGSDQRLRDRMLSLRGDWVFKFVWLAATLGG